MHFALRVTPRGGSDGIAGVGPAGELRVRVKAAPAGGAANAAALRVVAQALDVAPSRVRLDRGATARRKVIAVDDVDAQKLLRRWPGLLTTVD